MSHISDENLALIVEQGAPEEPKPEFVIFGPGDSITLTAVGQNFYSLALAFYGLPTRPLQHVHDRDGLEALVLRIRQIKRLADKAIAARERRAGQIPVRTRAVLEAFQRGDREGVSQALDHYLAGESVIPVRFRRPS